MMISQDGVSRPVIIIFQVGGWKEKVGGNDGLRPYPDHRDIGQIVFSALSFILIRTVHLFTV